MGLFDLILAGAKGAAKDDRVTRQAVRDLMSMNVPKDDAWKMALNQLPSDQVGWTPERVQSVIDELSSGSKTSGGIAWVNPQDFVNSNAINPQGIRQKAGELDFNKLTSNPETPFVSAVDGGVQLHEGRHRMQALADAGVTRAPIAVKDMTSKYPQTLNYSEANPSMPLFDAVLSGPEARFVGGGTTDPNLPDLKISDYIQATPENADKINSMMQGLLYSNAGKSNVATTAAEQTAEPLRDLMFMHNTSPDKLQRFAEIGGMPMPSIGVTRKDIPFEGYGDITLLGKPSSLDPAIKGHTAWNADAYTVRAPGPVQMSKKGAFKQLDADFSEFRDLGNVDHARQMLSNLETKGSLNEYEYNDFIRFMEDSPAVKAKWLRDVKGVELPVGKNGKLDRYGISDLVRDNDSEFRAWAANKAQDYFEPEKYLITNPNRDYYKSRASIKPYTAENVTSFMKKYKGAAQEGSMTTAGTGANRAATAKQLKSLDDMRAERGLLASREDVSIDKNTFSMMQDDLMEALKPYYKYDADGWRYLNEAGEMLVATDKKGMDKAMREYGFENVPDSIKQEIRDWKDSMRSAKTEYFESKPERVVGLNDFGGAIVPENTPQGILDMLSNAGVRVEKYADDAQRTELRNKFNDLMFSNPTGGLISQISSPLTDQVNQLESFKDGIIDPARAAASERYQTMSNELSGLLGDAANPLKPDINYEYGSVFPVKHKLDYKPSKLMMGLLAAAPESARPLLQNIDNTEFAVPSLLRELMYTYLLAEEANKRGRDEDTVDAGRDLFL